MFSILLFHQEIEKFWRVDKVTIRRREFLICVDVFNFNSFFNLNHVTSCRGEMDLVEDLSTHRAHVLVLGPFFDAVKAEAVITAVYRCSRVLCHALHTNWASDGFILFNFFFWFLGVGLCSAFILFRYSIWYLSSSRSSCSTPGIWGPAAASLSLLLRVPGSGGRHATTTSNQVFLKLFGRW